MRAWRDRFACSGPGRKLPRPTPPARGPNPQPPCTPPTQPRSLPSLAPQQDHSSRANSERALFPHSTAPFTAILFGEPNERGLSSGCPLQYKRAARYTNPANSATVSRPAPARLACFPVTMVSGL